MYSAAVLVLGCVLFVTFSLLKEEILSKEANHKMYRVGKLICAVYCTEFRIFRPNKFVSHSKQELIEICLPVSPFIRYKNNGFDSLTSTYMSSNEEKCRLSRNNVHFIVSHWV